MRPVLEGRPRRGVIDHAASGDNEIVAAIAGRKIRVMGFVAIGAGAVNVRFESGASGTALTGQMTIAGAGGQIEAQYNPLGWFETAEGQSLNMELSGAVSVDGFLVYIVVGPQTP